MTGNPALRPDPIHIARAWLPDLPAILALEETGFVSAERWGEPSWRGELTGERRRVLAASTEQLVGVISLALSDRGADLLRLVVAPVARRHGVGSALVRAGLAAVREAGARWAILEVRFDNDPAIALYQRLGFEQLAARSDYYGPGQHALILKYWDLQTAPPNEEQP